MHQPFETDEQLLEALALDGEFGISKVQRLAFWGYNRSARKIEELLQAGRIKQIDGVPFRFQVCVESTAAMFSSDIAPGI